MWIRTSRVIDMERRLAAGSATIEWLRQDVNRLNRENALLKSKVLGIPVLDIPQIERAEPQVDRGFAPRPPAVQGEEPTLKDLVAGNVSFEDMGDDAADKAGAGWDPSTGQVRYQ